MNNPPSFYFDKLYPWQDRILKVVNGIETGFYLTGGTAASRGYLSHRFSDDLDFFVNDDPRFTLWLDSAENILANKITALLDREEPKDLADIWGFCFKMGLPIKEAISGAQSKAAGVFPADLARLLCSVSQADWQSVRWIEAPPLETYLSQLTQLGESLLLLKE
jgi:hypothetical protein